MNSIHFVGYNGEHPNDFVYDIPEGFDCYLLILTTTPAFFRIQGKVSEYPPHTAILYPPHHAIWYSAAGKPYRNHWIRFSSDEAFVTNFPLQGIPFQISDPDYLYNLFQLLTWEASQLLHSADAFRNTVLITEHQDIPSEHPDTNNSQSTFVISQLLRILFYQLNRSITDAASHRYDCQLLSLRRKIAASPQSFRNMNRIAEELHISTGYLQLLYKQKFGISCIDDVIHFRLFKARDLLTYTTESIAEIAIQCGYNSTEHFCRQFKKHTGLTPGQFRKKHAW